MTTRCKFWMVLLSCVLVVFATTAEAAHFHPDVVLKGHPSKSERSCVTCHAAHSPLQVAQSVACPRPFAASEPISSTDPASRSGLDILAHHVRPPPAMI